MNKLKKHKVLILVISLFSFCYWGLDPDFICKVFSETPLTCGYSGGDSIMNGFIFTLRCLLSISAAAILGVWISKENNRGRTKRGDQHHN